MEEKTLTKPHTLFLEGRTRLDLTGVTDTSNFDEETLTIETAAGRLTVKGENVQVTKLSLENGEMSVEGTVTLIQYAASPVKSPGFFGRVFG